MSRDFNISIPDSEMRKLEADLKRYIQKKDDGIWEEMKRTGEDIRNQAVIDVPKRVQGGSLMKTIGTSGDKDKMEMSVSVGGSREAGYAPFVNYGTGKKVFKGYDFRNEDKNYARRFKRTKQIEGQPADGFFSKAVDEHYPNFFERIKKLMK